MPAPQATVVVDRDLAEEPAGLNRLNADLRSHPHVITQTLLPLSDLTTRDLANREAGKPADPV